MLEDFLRPEEAAAILDTTEGTLRWMRCKGKGPAFVKMGRFILYRRADIEEAASEKKRGAPVVTRARP